MRDTWITLIAAVTMLGCSFIGARAQDTATPPAAEASPAAGLDEATRQELKKLRADLALVVPVKLKNLPEWANPTVSCQARGGPNLDVMAEGFTVVRGKLIDQDAQELYDQGLISKADYEDANERKRKRLNAAEGPDISKNVVVGLGLRDNATVSDYSELHPVCVLYLARELSDRYVPLIDRVKAASITIEAPKAGVKPSAIYALTWKECVAAFAGADEENRLSPRLFPLVCGALNTDVVGMAEPAHFDELEPLKDR